MFLIFVAVVFGVERDCYDSFIMLIQCGKLLVSKSYSKIIHYKLIELFGVFFLIDASWYIMNDDMLLDKAVCLNVM